MGRRQHWQDRTDRLGRKVRGIARYHEATSATEASARGQWMHTEDCRKFADTLEMPVSDLCSGLCMTRPFDPDEWALASAAMRRAGR